MPENEAIPCVSKIFLACEGGGFLYSSDGGYSYKQMDGPPEAKGIECQTCDIYPNDLLVAGYANGTIWRTSNCGTSWTQSFVSRADEKAFNRYMKRLGELPSWLRWCLPQWFLRLWLDRSNNEG